MGRIGRIWRVVRRVYTFPKAHIERFLLIRKANKESYKKYEAWLEAVNNKSDTEQDILDKSETTDKEV